MRPLPTAIAASIALLVPATAEALCVYRGVADARTTLAQEFRDAPWVVRAKVLSARQSIHGNQRATLYRLEPVQAFKGRLPRQFTFSTTRNSGGFYLDGGDGKPAIGSEYLLFLVRQSRPWPTEFSLQVNYNCGQSRPWREVTAGQRSALLAMAARR